MISSLVAVSQADKACEPIRALQLGWKGVGILSQSKSEGGKKTYQWMQTVCVLIKSTYINESSLNVMTNANPEGTFHNQSKASFEPTNESTLIYCERINTLPP